MNSITRQYLFGLIFFAVGVYMATIRDYQETALFCIAGLSFIVNAMTLHERFAPYKKPLVVVSWILIITTSILFLYLLQFKYL